MKQLSIICLSILFSNCVFANQNFDKYIGCYSTLKFNGQTPKNEEYFQSQISKIESGYIDVETEKPIDGIIFQISQGSPEGEDDSVVVENTLLFTDRGTESKDEFGDHYFFDGVIGFSGSSEIATLHSKFNLHQIGKDLFELDVYSKFDEFNFEIKSNYLLQQKPCQNWNSTTSK